ncbi:MAG: hypothetical protein ACOYJB_02955 [Christensenellaceae bacterium]|jgi:hypothetical protein
MEKELDFIEIGDGHYGGDQNWATHHKWMKLGGCSAVCACEVCAYLAKTFERMQGLYPYDPEHISKEDFLRFFETMFAYIHPGIGGLTSIDKFSDMFSRYMREKTNIEPNFRKLYGNESYADAERFVKEAIDSGLPVMYLMLSHKDIAFDEYEWHWFTLTGYKENEHGTDVIFATWAKRHAFDLYGAWNTGRKWRGGMVCLAP